MITKADSQLIRRLNETQILQLIRRLGPVSRIELARQTKMSKVAVFEIVNRLIMQRLVMEVGKGASTSRGGKRPSLVKLDASHHFVVGIEIRRNDVQIGLADLEAQISQIKKFNNTNPNQPEKVIQKIFKRIDALISEFSKEGNRLVSIGIGIPGIIDYEKGRLRFADTLPGWDKLNICEVFSKRYHVPVIIENDVNTITLGESILGVASDVDDMVCLWIGSGIGAGVIINKQLVRGFGGGAGEIGYLELNGSVTQNNKSYFKNSGKFYGDLLAEDNLHRVLSSEINRLSGQVPKQKSLSALLKAKEHDTIVHNVLDEYAWYLAFICLDIMKVINPHMLVLSGTAIESSQYLFRTVGKIIEKNASKIPLHIGAVKLGTLKEEAGLRGAIALALQVIFD